MSSAEVEKTADVSADDETDWLYGGEKYTDGKSFTIF